MKKILLSFAFFASLASANTINAIAVVVDKEPITTYDIDQTMKALKIDRNKALGVLINEKMEISQMKQLGIVVNDLELDDAINKMLAQNKTTLNAFKANLKSKNQSYEQFRTNFKKDLEKRKLYEKIASMAKTDFSDDGAKKFFEQNKDKFTFYTQINANIYLSNNPQTLENIKNTKKQSLNFRKYQKYKKTILKPQNASLNTSNADPRLLGLLSQIPVGGFSPVLNGKNGYELYEVKSKDGTQTPEYEQVKNEVLNAYVSEQRQNFIQDYFDKLRSKINIEYLR
ncbi:peptidylprolyl isomerase SalC [Campylobacter jejuni]|nr:peptidylprolyl isomerase SalC [Campylobacter jejuni]ECR3301007.1 peptidylprolyl isomerase SalC [Campylobacter jejuni]ECR3469731.1 peptidylprolyl isomerase SalC [Campylobacter jejuni]